MQYPWSIRPKTPVFRRRFVDLGRAAAGGLLATWFSRGLMAQDAAPTTEPASNVVVSQPFPWVGLFVVLFLAGGCLFAVCRSSRRN